MSITRIVTARMSEEYHQALHDESRATGVSINQIVLGLIYERLKDRIDKLNQQDKQEHQCQPQS